MSEVYWYIHDISLFELTGASALSFTSVLREVVVGSLAAAFLDSFEVAEFAAFFDDALAWVLNDVLTISLGIFLDCRFGGRWRSRSGVHRVGTRISRAGSNGHCL